MTRRTATGDPVSTRWTARRTCAPNPLWGSNGVAFGPDGRLYVAQYLGGQISAVDVASGDVEVVVPSGGVVQSPDDLAFGADGSMYITDLVPGRVWKRSVEGEFSLVSSDVVLPNGITCVGDRLFVNEMRWDGRLFELTGGEARVMASGLAMGNAMQVGPDGLLYYPWMLTGQVYRVGLDGGEPELVASDVHEPVAVRFDLAGALLVLSRGEAGIVTRIDLASGERKLVHSGIVGLDNAAVDSENRLYVSSYASGGITELRSDGTTREVVPQGDNGPFGLTIDFGGRVLTADHYRIESGLAFFSHGIVADGESVHVTSQYGEVRSHTTDGESRSRASGLQRPQGIAVRPDGALVVAETDAGRVIAISEADEVVEIVSDLDSPVDVAFAGNDLLITDAVGVVYLWSGDEKTVLAADLAAPQGVAVHDGRAFVAEAGTARLLSFALETGEMRVEAEGLPLINPTERNDPGLFAAGMPGVPQWFAGVAVRADGTVFVGGNGEGTVIELKPH